MDFRGYLEHERVASVGVRPAVSVASDATAQAAVELMTSRRVGCLLVVDGDELVGIFTERAVLSKLAGSQAKTGFDAGMLNQIRDAIGGEGSLAKFAAMIDQDGDGNPLDDIAGFASSLFGKK